MRLTEGVSAGRILMERSAAIAARVTDLYFAAHPQLEERWKEGRKRCTEDTLRHIDSLAEALFLGQPELFVEYAAWVSVLLARLKIPCEALTSNFAILDTVLGLQLDIGSQQLVSRYLTAGIKKIEGGAPELPCHMGGDGELDILGRQYVSALLGGDRRGASKLVLDAAERGTPIKEIYLKVFQRSQHEIGRLWQINKITVATEHYCTASTQLIMSQLYPYIFNGIKTGGTYVGTCVAGNLHEIGGRMIADFFEMAGWNSYYLGANTPSESVVQTVVERKAAILGVSATMTGHVGAVEELIQKMRADPGCGGVKILVGGHPFNLAPNLWRVVGADGSARDADRVIALAGTLTGLAS